MFQSSYESYDHTIIHLAFTYILLGYVSISYNQPKFCATASWNVNGIIIANSSLLGHQPDNVFIDINNSVYVAVYWYNRILSWSAGSLIPTRTLTGGLNGPHGIFVTINGDIYVDNGYKGRVRKWAPNMTSSTIVMYVTSQCDGLFVDINNTIYCSQSYDHQVIANSQEDGANFSTIVAGTSFPGSASNMLNYPNGIFVDINFNLYVADYGNNRIQLFKYGQLFGTTVAGGELEVNVALNRPTTVVLDADNNLFIVDSFNNRIIMLGPIGFRCLIGCLYTNGLDSGQLQSPYWMAFDSYGNMFVTDWDSNQLQKFILATNSCGEFDKS
ncbi:unnamed protein product [Rotaria sordida]|uniref:NHL repeat-containing protein n=1 Tax=Rotaria sordida TaxID=392033 RepID=A0A815JZC7_9BILA|nr:unnamed protein product [Rotaria sordida]